MLTFGLEDNESRNGYLKQHQSEFVIKLKEKIKQK